MEIENASIVNYIYNETGNLGGYPMVQLIQKEIEKQNLLGSKINNSEFGSMRFENLIIPAGLISFSNDYYKKGGGLNDNKIKIKEKVNGTINDDIFNKVFDLITKCPGKSRTKKNLEKKIKSRTKKTKRRIKIK